MTTLMRFDPFRESLGLRDAMNRPFEENFVRPSWFSNGVSTYAPIDLYETEQGYQVRVLVPGVKAEEIELTVLQNTLTMKSQYEPLFDEGKQVNWLVLEIGSGSFARTITFPKPVDADHVETSYEDGILSIRLPFSEVSRPKKISITNGHQKQFAVEAEKRS